MQTKVKITSLPITILTEFYDTLQFCSSLMQISGDGWWPAPGQWYDDLRFGKNTSLNILFYGTYNFFRDDVSPTQDYWSDAISFNRQLDESHFSGKHIYRLEWELPDKEKGEHGHLHWFLDGELIFALNGTSLEKADTGESFVTKIHFFTTFLLFFLLTKSHPISFSTMKVVQFQVSLAQSFLIQLLVASGALHKIVMEDVNVRSSIVTHTKFRTSVDFLRGSVK